MSLEHDIRETINRCSAENESNTPDYVLARFLVGCLSAFHTATREREQFFGVAHEPGQKPAILTDQVEKPDSDWTASAPASVVHAVQAYREIEEIVAVTEAEDRAACSRAFLHVRKVVHDVIRKQPAEVQRMWDLVDRGAPEGDRAVEQTVAVGVSKAESDVLAERQKQRTKWSAEHDDEHMYGHLRVVAAILAVNGTDARVVDPLDRVADDTDGRGGQHDNWGLSKKHAPRQRLVVAAALLLAEIERIDRKGGA
jgi:hypothetical protein